MADPDLQPTLAQCLKFGETCDLVAAHDRAITDLQLWRANITGRAAAVGVLAGIVSGVAVTLLVKVLK